MTVVTLPANLDTVPVRGRFASFDGASLSGTVTFTPTVSTLTSPSTGTVLLARPVVGRIVSGALYAADGAGVLQLFATDDTDVSVTGWQYVVTETISGGGGRPPYRISVPVSAKAAGLDLWSVAPEAPTDPAGATSYVLLPAFTALQARVQAVETTLGTGGTGDPLRAWRAALRNRKNRPARWLAIGDSYTEGQGASTKALRWVDRTLVGLRAAWPCASPGGAGYVPSWFGVYGPDSPWDIPYQAISGGTQFSWGYDLGRRLTTFNQGGFIEFVVTGDVIDLWCPIGGVGNVATVAVDGVQVATVRSTTRYDTGDPVRVDLGKAGQHTIRIVATGADGFILSGWTVYDGDATAGITLYEASHSGYRSGDYTDTGKPSRQPWGGVDPDLLTLWLGSNDVGQGTSPEQVRANLLRTVQDVRSGTTGDLSVVIGLYPRRLNGIADGTWLPYENAMRSLAGEVGAALLDMSSTPVPLRSDNLHPNNDGQQAIATAALALLS